MFSYSFAGDFSERTPISDAPHSTLLMRVPDLIKLLSDDLPSLQGKNQDAILALFKKQRPLKLSTGLNAKGKLSITLYATLVGHSQKWHTTTGNSTKNAAAFKREAEWAFAPMQNVYKTLSGVYQSQNFVPLNEKDCLLRDFRADLSK